MALLSAMDEFMPSKVMLNVCTWLGLMISYCSTENAQRFNFVQ